MHIFRKKQKKSSKGADIINQRLSDNDSNLNSSENEQIKVKVEEDLMNCAYWLYVNYFDEDD